MKQTIDLYFWLNMDCRTTGKLPFNSTILILNNRLRVRAGDQAKASKSLSKPLSKIRL